MVKSGLNEFSGDWLRFHQSHQTLKQWDCPVTEKQHKLKHLNPSLLWVSKSLRVLGELFNFLTPSIFICQTGAGVGPEEQKPTFWGPFELQTILAHYPI